MQNNIKVLGAYGSKDINKNISSFLITKEIVIDAGNVLQSLGEDSIFIEHLFITHAHLDHIAEIPFLVDAFFEKRKKPLKVYALKETIKDIQDYIFNWKIWPDFSKINLIDSVEKSIEFIPIEIEKEYVFHDCIITPVENNHAQGSCGYLISKEQNSILLTSDTASCENIWNIVNNNFSITSLIIEVSFPSSLENLAIESKHLTPKLLEKELLSLNRDDVNIYINHIKPIYENQIIQELKQIDNIKYNIQTLTDGDTIDIKNKRLYHDEQSKDFYIEQLNEIGYALTSVKNLDRLMEKILFSAKRLTSADAGTFYLMSENEKSLQFTSVQTDSLNIKLGGENGSIPWPNLALYDENGEKNNINISVNCALRGELINIPDVYESDDYNFDGPKAFDMSTGYRTKSMLVVPMKNHENDVIGVLQLINKENSHGEVIPFTNKDEKLVLSMSSQAAVTITNAKLIHDLEKLLNSFIQSIATAIGEKSKYTAGHVNRVAELSTMIAKAVNDDQSELFKDKSFDKDQLKEIDVAAWMHDVGKITTPEYVVDKAKKLETIYDRMNTVEAKFEILKQQKYIQLLQAKVQSNESEQKKLTIQYNNDIEQLNKDLEFLKTTNTGGEFLGDDKIARIEDIAKKEIIINGQKTNLLSENEVKNLSIKKGTLTDEERFVINNHAKVSYDMLKSLPFPKKLKNVPKIAGGHHEKICGGGYPFNLKGDQISFESRILAIADIFEALTAADRPYKKPNTLNQAMRILSFMVKDEELDKDLVKLFVEKKLHLEYAKDNLTKEQIDEVTVSFDDL